MGKCSTMLLALFLTLNFITVQNLLAEDPMEKKVTADYAPENDLQVDKALVTPTLPLAWEYNGVETPESAYFDAESGQIFVSNIVGAPTDKDGNGYISVLKTDGTLVEKTWVTGLNAPKGMRSQQGVLWVSDIDELVSIDIKTKKITQKIKVEGAKFLNDIAITPKGAVLVSDMLTGKVHELRKGKLKVFLESKDLPNGLLIDGTNLIMAAWGEEIAADFSTKVLGKLYSIDLMSKKKKEITTTPVGNLDGLEKSSADNFVVTDWVKGDVYSISAKGVASKLMGLPQGAADLAVLNQEKLLVIPQMNQNKVSAYRLP